MKNLLTMLCLLLGTFAWAAEGDFTKTMTQSELAKSGLEKLSPEELAQLKAVVERYKAGAVEIVQQQAETKVAAAEAKAKQAEQTMPGDKKKPGWLRALITLENSTGNVEQDGAIESKIAGNFTGWSGKTVFHLE